MYGGGAWQLAPFQILYFIHERVSREEREEESKRNGLPSASSPFALGKQSTEAKQAEQGEEKIQETRCTNKSPKMAEEGSSSRDFLKH